jgi:hypothetical protein
MHGRASRCADTGWRTSSKYGMSSGTSVLLIQHARGTVAANTNIMPRLATNVVRAISPRSGAASAVASSAEFAVRATPCSGSQDRVLHRR